MLPALDHVQVAAPEGCEAAARHFYGQLLGLPELPKPEGMAPDGAWFRLAQGELHVGVQREFQPALKAHPGLRWPSIRALEAVGDRLVAAGHPVQWDERLPGVRRFFTQDPWGNRLELLAPLDDAPG